MAWIIALLPAATAPSKADDIGSVSYTYNWTGGIPDLELPQFDPSQGTLQSVAIAFTENYLITFYTGSSGSPITFSAGGTGTDYVDGIAYGSNLLADIDYGPDYDYSPNMFGFFGFSGGFGTPELAEFGGPLVAAIIGTGSVSWECECGMFGGAYGESVSDSTLTPESGTLTLEYNYAIPEPGSYGLMVAGLGTLVFAARRRPDHRSRRHSPGSPGS